MATHFYDSSLQAEVALAAPPVPVNYGALTDADLVRLAQTGDTNAFETLVPVTIAQSCGWRCT